MLLGRYRRRLNALHVLDTVLSLENACFSGYFYIYLEKEIKLLCMYIFIYLFLQLKSDSDRGEFSIKYLLSGEGAGDVFEIDEYTGDIRTLKKLDREEKAFYVLQAQAINRRTNEPEEPQSEFIIKVQDINDNVPQFQNEPYVSSIPEMCPVGKFIKTRRK